MWRPLLLLLVMATTTSTYRILGIFPHGAMSHFQVLDALMEGLAKKGHEVVVVSPFPRTTPLERYTDISLSETIPILTSEIPMENVGDNNVGTTLGMLFHGGFDACERVLSLPNIQKLTEVKFDLVIYELFNTDCFLALVHKFKIPYIALSSSTFMPWHNERFGNPDNPSFVPLHFLPLSDHMTYKERFTNSAYYLAVHWVTRFYLEGPTRAIVDKHLGPGGPALRDIARNTSLLLLNTHFSLNRPRPFVPAIIEVGGIHLKPPAKLPKDIQKFMNEAQHGVIMFSLGSTVKSSTLPAEKREALVQAFAALPQRVLWKWEGELPGKPANLMVSKWLPQHAILNHPNTKVFLTHAGLMGSIEAVSAGVPMVGVSLFGDQPLNLAAHVQNGVAVRLDYLTMTKQSVLDALKSVLDNPIYAENSKRLSEVFNDRPLPPLETAIYWTEYVIRHQGASNLRSASADLTWYQYYLLDILAPVFGVILLVILITYLMVKKIFVLVFGSFGNTTTKQPAAPKTNKGKQKKH